MSAAKKLNPIITSDQAMNRRILIVEDEPNVAQSYQGILENTSDRVVSITRSSRSRKAEKEGKDLTSNQFELVICNNSDDAILKVKESLQLGKPFAMGFFDVLLEGSRLDGIELVKEIFQIDPHLKAVFVTAYQDRSVDAIDSLLQPEHSERWDYLNKPFSHGEILQKARHLTSVWNLERQKENQDLMLQEAQQRLMESDRFSTVAAVSRSVCHEFGNLLVHINGNAELYKDGTEEQKTKAFEVILQACDTAKSVLDKLKNMADHRTVDELKSVVDIRHPVDVALRLLDHQLHTQNIKICRIKNEAVEVNVIQNELVQVFVNLIINAMHAMDSSGQIDISVGKRNDFAEIIVHDYGPGVPSHLIQKVTEPLFTTKGSDGTGLGLSICKEIVEIDHGGEFIIENHSSKGAQVIIRIPVEKESQNG